MSETEEFCPRCGETVPPREEPLPGTARDRDALLCDSCYFADFDLVDAPDRIEVSVCAQCGAVHKGNRWVDVGARDYTDVAVEQVTEALGVHLDARDVSWAVDPEQIDQNSIRMHCQFSGVVRDTYHEEAVMVPVMISRGTCTRCGRIAGGSYAGVVQVRATDRTPTTAEADRAEEIVRELVADHEADGDREAFVTDVEETPEGPSIKLSTNSLASTAAERITREFGGTVEDHPTLVTEDSDGNEVYRVTFAVRLPKFTPGDIIDPEDGEGPVLVRSAKGNLKGVRLASGNAYEAPYEAGSAPDAHRLGTRGDAVETTVVTVEDEHAVQVLDPKTYEAKTVPRPDFFDPDAETIAALKSRAGVHLLPDETA